MLSFLRAEDHSTLREESVSTQAHFAVQMQALAARTNLPCSLVCIYYLDTLKTTGCREVVVCAFIQTIMFTNSQAPNAIW